MTARGLLLAAFCLVFPGMACAEAGPALDEAGAPCIADREALLALDFDAFDQDMTGGWRAVEARAGCEEAAADLLGEYHAILRERGEPVMISHEGEQFPISETGTVTILYWHEGQVRAGLGQTEAAIELFGLSIKPQNIQGWNNYARASIAFLQQDLETLKAERDLLAARDLRGLNTSAVDGLIRCFDRPYLEAYGSAECRNPPPEGAPE